MKKRMGEITTNSEDGKEVQLIIYQNFKETTNKDSGGIREYIPGEKEIITSAGQRVNRIEKGKYQIIETGEYLISDYPGAI
jgi:hypothetical protein